MWLKRFGNKKYIAVDVGSFALKIICLSSLPKGFSVARAVSFPGVHELDLEGRGLESLISLLQEAASAAGLKGARVVTAIGHQKVITRHILVPQMPRRELERAIKWEAEKYIPLPVDELVIRYLDLGQKKIENTVQMHLLLVAVPRQLVYGFYEGFARAGLNIKAIDLQALALWRVFGGVVAPAPAENAYGVLDIGFATTHFLVIREKKLSFERVFPFGGSQAAVQLERTLGLDEKEARRLIAEKAEFLSEAALTEDLDAVQYDLLLRQGLSGLVTEIRRSLDFYRLQERDFPLEKLIIT
ncbi:MAG: type IV pilus assembly protein PilM, partial [Firmicutes bacterium]|nr:type IV pilus assembly protein PilM [Bacillota bacterium]